MLVAVCVPGVANRQVLQRSWGLSRGALLHVGLMGALGCRTGRVHGSVPCRLSLCAASAALCRRSTYTSWYASRGTPWGHPLAGVAYRYRSQT